MTRNGFFVMTMTTATFFLRFKLTKYNKPSTYLCPLLDGVSSVWTIKVELWWIGEASGVGRKDFRGVGLKIGMSLARGELWWYEVVDGIHMDGEDSEGGENDGSHFLLSSLNLESSLRRSHKANAALSTLVAPWGFCGSSWLQNEAMRYRRFLKNSTKDGGAMKQHCRITTSIYEISQRLMDWGALEQ